MALSRERGAAAAELVIVFVPMTLMVLGVMQLSQILVADLLVDYAAFAAARVAIVTLPEGDLPPDLRPRGNPPPPDPTPNVLGEALAETTDVRIAARAWRRSVRYERIARAASLVMVPVSPSSNADPDLSVAEALDVEWRFPSSAVDKVGPAARELGYAAAATGVVLVSPDDLRYVTSFDPSGEVNVRATYLFRCAIPLARRLLCRRFEELPGRVRLETAALGAWAAGAPRAWSEQRYLALGGQARMRNEGR